jgi:hypothetical protein
MKTQLDRNLYLRGQLVSQIIRAYGEAYHYGWTHARLLDETKKIMESAGPKFPQYMREYVRGIDHYLLSDLYRVRIDGAAPLLVFGGWIDGKFYSTHSNRADYYQNQGIEPSDFSKLSENKVTHYWAHKTDKPFGTLE